MRESYIYIYVNEREREREIPVDERDAEDRSRRSATKHFRKAPMRDI
jgi:hypothetical protein